MSIFTELSQIFRALNILELEASSGGSNLICLTETATAHSPFAAGDYELTPYMKWGLSLSSFPRSRSWVCLGNQLPCCKEAQASPHRERKEKLTISRIWGPAKSQHQPGDMWVKESSDDSRLWVFLMRTQILWSRDELSLTSPVWILDPQNRRS